MRQMLSALLLCMATQAFAGSVFLNGVKIDGVTNQTFEKATVRIDTEGNVRIEAPGYQVKQIDPNGPKEAPRVLAGSPVPTKKYYLVTTQTAPGMTDYDVDVYINAKWIVRLKNADAQYLNEVTQHLSPGKNDVLLVASKLSPNGTRKSTSAEHVFRVILGEGSVASDRVTIDLPLVRYERSAANIDSETKQFTINVR